MEDKKSEPQKSRTDRFLENKLWKVIQIFAPLAAIFITIYIFIITQRPAQITIRGIGYITLLTSQADLRKDVIITYRSNEIANIAKYSLLIQNNSHRDIDGKDIHYLQWYPPKASTILSADIIDKSEGQGNFISVDYSQKDILSRNAKRFV